MKKEIYIRDLSKEWLDYKRLVVKYSTLARYESIVECHLKDMDKEKPISCWKEPDYEKWYHNFIQNSELKESTHNVINVVLKDILKFAIKRHQFDKLDLSFMKKIKEKKEIHTLAIDEYRQLSQYCKTHMNPATASIYVSLHTGLRVGEICGLKWDDIHLDDQIIYVNRTVQRLKNSDPDGPKTKKMILYPKSQSSKRTVVLNDFLIEYLKVYKSIVNPESDNCFLITNSNEIPEVRNIERKFKTICNKLSISITFHGLRHTFATNCLECEMDIKTISELLGHSSVAFTMDMYVHPSLSYMKEQINKISKLMVVE